MPRVKTTPRHPSSKPAPRAGKATSSLKASAAAATGTKHDHLINLLSRARGASIADMMYATGWQAHSVRGALAGTFRKRGFTIASEKTDGERRYRIVATAS